MKQLRKYILAAIVTASCGAASAQTFNSAYFTDDFKFRHTMNPAFANEQNYLSLPALGNVSVSMHGNFGLGDILFDNPNYGHGSDKQKTTFMNPYISANEALGGFSKGNNRLTGDVNLTLLSAGFKGFKGYNTIELGIRSTVGAVLPYELFEFAKNTGNQTYNIGDVSVNAMAYAELAFGHSHQINKNLRIGAKMKLLFGAARADVKLQNLKADLAQNDKWTVSGQGVANVSMKGFSYVESQEEYNDPGKGTYNKVDDVDVDGAGLGGFGMAFDLGAVYKIDKHWTVSAAVTDLGFINWTNNMQAANRAKTFTFNGFHDTSVTSDGGNTIDDQTDKYGDQLADFANLKDEGDKGKRTTGIGATVNLGAEYVLPAYKNLKFGALSSTRLYGKYSWTEGRVSANISPLKWIDGGINFAVSSFTASMGWIVNFHPKGINLFVGMDHLLGKQSKERIPLSSNASVNVGFNVAW